MQLKNPLLFVEICALLQWTPVSGSVADLLGETDPTRYMFFDPAEECSKSCFASFKYCSHSAREDWAEYECTDGATKDHLTWMADGTDDGGSVKWVELGSGRPVPVFNADETYTLKWQNTNPKYPTTITWRPDFSGASFFLYTMIDTGKTVFPFAFGKLKEYMQIGTDINSNGTDEDVLRQPEPPTDGDSSFRPYSDRTSAFFHDSEIYSALSHLQEHDRGYIAHEKQDATKIWKIGVCVGVGMGIRLVGATMFAAGWWVGQKKISKVKSTD